MYEFRYLESEIDQPAVALLMPPSQPTYQDGDLFAVMDQNIPEGDLYLRLRAMFPKQQLTPMHLLALVNLSHDRQMLLVDRFDVEPDGRRLGFEDVAALMGLRVRDIQSDRKYQGSYQRIAELLRYIQLDNDSLVTTSIYRYTRYEGGPELEDQTLALKLFAGRHHTQAYPTTQELLRFGTVAQAWRLGMAHSP